LHIDVHAHFLPRSVVDACDAGRDWHGIRFEVDEQGQLVSTTSAKRFALPWPDFRAPISDRIAEMDKLRVDMQVISMSPTLWRHELEGGAAADMARDVNDETAAIVAEHPSRFRGFAFLPLQDPKASVAELERSVRDLGLVGAAVSTNVAGENWDVEGLFPVLEAAEALGALLFVHPAAVRTVNVMSRYHLRNMIGNPLETTVTIGSLVFGGVFDRLPNLKMVFAHGGGYATFAVGRFDHGHVVRPEAQAIRRVPTDYLRSLYYDCLTHSAHALRYLVDEVGIDRVVLGSDFPADMGYRDPVGWVENAEGLDQAEKQQILGGNLERLLDIGPAAPA
jgi:aminocarboxymuconate-semialdehyde decarboxylase